LNLVNRGLETCQRDGAKNLSDDRDKKGLEGEKAVVRGLLRQRADFS
jgi:hypothetical protein